MAKDKRRGLVAVAVEQQGIDAGWGRRCPRRINKDRTARAADDHPGGRVRPAHARKGAVGDQVGTRPRHPAARGQQHRAVRPVNRHPLEVGVAVAADLPLRQPIDTGILRRADAVADLDVPRGNLVRRQREDLGALDRRVLDLRPADGRVLNGGVGDIDAGIDRLHHLAVDRVGLGGGRHDERQAHLGQGDGLTGDQGGCRRRRRAIHGKGQRRGVGDREDLEGLVPAPVTRLADGNIVVDQTAVGRRGDAGRRGARTRQAADRLGEAGGIRRRDGKAIGPYQELREGLPVDRRAG